MWWDDQNRPRSKARQSEKSKKRQYPAAAVAVNKRSLSRRVNLFSLINTEKTKAQCVIEVINVSISSSASKKELTINQTRATASRTLAVHSMWWWSQLMAWWKRKTMENHTKKQQRENRFDSTTICMHSSRSLNLFFPSQTTVWCVCMAAAVQSWVSNNRG